MYKNMGKYFCPGRSGGRRVGWPAGGQNRQRFTPSAPDRRRWSYLAWRHCLSTSSGAQLAPSRRFCLRLNPYMVGGERGTLLV